MYVSRFFLVVLPVFFCLQFSLVAHAVVVCDLNPKANSLSKPKSSGRYLGWYNALYDVTLEECIEEAESRIGEILLNFVHGGFEINTVKYRYINGSSKKIVGKVKKINE